MKTIGTILKSLRIKKNITLDQLAAEINEKFNVNTTTSMISKWETGKASPIYDHLKNLASYYNVSTDFLLNFNQNEDFNNKELDNDLEINKKRIRRPKEFYTHEEIVKLLDDNRFTNKELLLIKDYISFLKFRRQNKL